MGKKSYIWVPYFFPVHWKARNISQYHMLCAVLIAPGFMCFVKCSPSLFPYSLPALAVMMGLITESDIWQSDLWHESCWYISFVRPKAKIDICHSDTCRGTALRRRVNLQTNFPQRGVCQTNWCPPTEFRGSRPSDTRDFFSFLKDAHKVARVSLIDLIRNPRKAHAPHMIRL